MYIENQQKQLNWSHGTGISVVSSFAWSQHMQDKQEFDSHE